MPTPAASGIDLNPHDLLEVLQVLDTYLPGVEVRAFGSRVRWTAKPYSDLDLALMTLQPLSLDQTSQLREALDETTLPFKVDIVDWSSTSETFRNIIQSNNVVIRPPSSVATDQWTAMTLDEALEALLDYRGKTPEKTTRGIPLITAKIVKNGRIETPTEFIATKGYDAWMTRGLPKAGDVVLTTEAPLGEVAQLDSDCVALAQRIVVLRGKSGVLDNTYLKYLLQTYEMQEQLASRATGTTVVGIKQSELRKISLRFPPIDQQVVVASILATLDDKIELNRRMNETLEAMARAIFQSWFVDFDPVRAKASGENADAICQRLGLTPELLALFPDSLEDSEFGEIPKGWGVSEFSETIQIIGGGTPKTSVEGFWGGCIPWFSVVDAPAESDVYVIDTEKKITKGGLDNSSTKLLPEGTTIISARGTVGKVALVGTPMTMNQSCYGLRGRNGCDTYTYYATRELVSALKQHSHGAVFDTITKETFASVRVVSFDAASKAFDVVVATKMLKIKANNLHTKSLIDLRNALLPKLLSGELTPSPL